MNPIPDLGGMAQLISLFAKIISNSFSLIITIVLIIVFVFLYLKREKFFFYVKKVLQITHIKHRIALGVFTLVMLVLLLPSEKIVSIKGSGTRVYVLRDFFIAQKGNLTNNPIGVGIGVSISSALPSLRLVISIIP